MFSVNCYYCSSPVLYKLKNVFKTHLPNRMLYTTKYVALLLNRNPMWLFNTSEIFTLRLITKIKCKLRPKRRYIYTSVRSMNQIKAVYRIFKHNTFKLTSVSVVINRYFPNNNHFTHMTLSKLSSLKIMFIENAAFCNQTKCIYIKMYILYVCVSVSQSVCVSRASKGPSPVK